MASGQTRGHRIDWDGNMWHYADTGEPILEHGGKDRPCTVCGKLAGEDGRDPCLTGLPDEIESACCGHGVEPGYIYWPGQLDRLATKGKDDG